MIMPDHTIKGVGLSLRTPETVAPPVVVLGFITCECYTQWPSEGGGPGRARARPKRFVRPVIVRQPHVKRRANGLAYSGCPANTNDLATLLVTLHGQGLYCYIANGYNSLDPSLLSLSWCCMDAYVSAAIIYRSSIVTHKHTHTHTHTYRMHALHKL